MDFKGFGGGNRFERFNASLTVIDYKHVCFLFFFYTNVFLILYDFYCCWGINDFSFIVREW